MTLVTATQVINSFIPVETVIQNYARERLDVFLLYENIDCDASDLHLRNSFIAEAGRRELVIMHV